MLDEDFDPGLAVNGVRARLSIRPDEGGTARTFGTIALFGCLAVLLAANSLSYDIDAYDFWRTEKAEQIAITPQDGGVIRCQNPRDDFSGEIVPGASTLIVPPAQSRTAAFDLEKVDRLMDDRRCQVDAGAQSASMALHAAEALPNPLMLAAPHAMRALKAMGFAPVFHPSQRLWNASLPQGLTGLPLPGARR